LKLNIRTALTLMAGVAVGAVATQALFAQTKPPAYVIVAIRKVNDAEAFKTGVIDKATPAALQAAGGKYVVRTQSITPLDGTPPQRFVLIAFDNAEKAKAWNDSAAQKPINEARIKSTDSLSFIVEGLQ
jgi:uncharacterized protein (DUF1330 family)